MVDMAERLQSIEGHLNDIKTLLQQMSANAAAPPQPAATAALKPPRTKRPSQQPSGEAKQPSGEQK
jgi:hypothetical protein